MRYFFLYPSPFSLYAFPFCLSYPYAFHHSYLSPSFLYLLSSLYLSSPSWASSLSPSPENYGKRYEIIHLKRIRETQESMT